MKVEFEDKSYLEINNDIDPQKAMVVMVARDQNDNNITMISMSIEIDTLKEMIKNLEEK